MTEPQESPTFTDLEEGKAETPASSVQAAVDRAREAEQAERATAAPPKRGRGRPKGSKTRRGAPRPAAPEPELEEEEGPPSPAEVRGVAAMWAVLWTIAARSGRVRPLEGEESIELATATIPVLRKYAPIFATYAMEINFGFVLVGTIMSTIVEPAPAPTPLSAPEPTPAPAS